MRLTHKIMALLAILCLSLNARAQYDEEYEVEEWTLDEEEEPKPQHKEYKNAIYLHYSHARYKVSDESRVNFNEFQLGYNRLIQVVEEKPYFVEAGANMKFSWARGADKAFVLTFRVPVNVLYKIYLSREKDYAIAPFAGASVRLIAADLAAEQGQAAAIDIHASAAAVAPPAGDDAGAPDGQRAFHRYDPSLVFPDGSGTIDGVPVQIKGDMLARRHDEGRLAPQGRHIIGQRDDIAVGGAVDPPLQRRPRTDPCRTKGDIPQYRGVEVIRFAIQQPLVKGCARFRGVGGS